MASYSIAAGQIGVYGKTLVANTVDTVTFPGDVTGSIEVSTNGSAALYFTVDGSTPTVGGAATHELLAGAVAARIVQSVEVGTTVVKVISAGTPTYSVAVASMTDVPWFSSQTGASGSAASSAVETLLIGTDLTLADGVTMATASAGFIRVGRLVHGFGRLEFAIGAATDDGVPAITGMPADWYDTNMTAFYWLVDHTASYFGPEGAYVDSDGGVWFDGGVHFNSAHSMTFTIDPMTWVSPDPG